MVKSKRLIISVCMLLFLAVSVVYSQDQDIRKKWVNRFDINSVNFDNPEVQKKADLLRKYFFCKAVREDNPGPCAKLNEAGDIGGADNCDRSINYFKTRFTAISVAFNETIPMSVLARDCPSDPAGKEKCLNNIRAIRSNDTSRCTDSMCKALISEDKSGINDSDLQDVVTFVSAYKNADTKKCKGITSVNSKAFMADCACEYLLSKEGVCENDPGFIKFKEWYLSKMGSK